MVKISEIVSQNLWWNQGKNFVQYDRHLNKAKPIFFKRREPDFKKGNIYILRGPRQVGKTTYLKDTVRRLIENGIPPNHILYLSLDFFTSRRELRNAINFFLDSTREADESYLLFDEITSLKDWNLELKYLADQGITDQSVIIATGSSAVKLKEKGELLPGRGLEGNEYYIKPLSFREFVLQSIDFICAHISNAEFLNSLTKLKSILREYSVDLHSGIKGIQNEILKIIPYKRELQYFFRIYLIGGGNPGVINHYFINRYEIQIEKIDPLIAEIFIRDVLGDLSRLQRQEVISKEIMRAVLEKYGSRYSLTKLSRGIERTHVTTIDYLQFLEDSFILSVFYAYDFSRKYIKQKGDKKVYFFDPFIYHSVKSYLSGREVWEVITESLMDEARQSRLVEGIVMMQLLMHKEIPYLRKGNTFLWYYYDKGGKEIDAVMRINRKHLGIEVKYQTQVDERDIKQIVPIENYILLSKDDMSMGENMLIVPVDVFLSLIKVSDRNI